MTKQEFYALPAGTPYYLTSVVVSNQLEVHATVSKRAAKPEVARRNNWVADYMFLTELEALQSNEKRLMVLRDRINTTLSLR